MLFLPEAASPLAHGLTAEPRVELRSTCAPLDAGGGNDDLGRGLTPSPAACPCIHAGDLSRGCWITGKAPVTPSKLRGLLPGAGGGGLLPLAPCTNGNASLRCGINIPIAVNSSPMSPMPSAVASSITACG